MKNFAYDVQFTKKQCKFDAIEGELRQKHIIDEGKCIGCHLCMQKCPKEAIKNA